MSDTLVLNGAITDLGTTANEIAVAPASAHIGTATANFTLQFQNALIELKLGQDVAADAALYAALNAAVAPISWST